jgi:hypothetical protein
VGYRGSWLHPSTRSTGTRDETECAGVRNSARREKPIWDDGRRVSGRARSQVLTSRSLVAHSCSLGSLAKVAAEGECQGELGADFLSLFALRAVKSAPALVRGDTAPSRASLPTCWVRASCCNDLHRHDTIPGVDKDTKCGSLVVMEYKL